MSITVFNSGYLFTEDRLDYVVKYCYFKSLLTGIGIPERERVYKWHIQHRTGGNEPRSPKNCIGDYIKGCADLLNSLQQYRFNGKYYIKIGPNKLLVSSGAHRISATFALGIPIIVDFVPRNGKNYWDYNWFVEKGMCQDDLDTLKSDWESVKELIRYEDPIEHTVGLL